MDQFALDKIASILSAQGAVLKSLEDRITALGSIKDEVRSLVGMIHQLRQRLDDLENRESVAVSSPAKGRKAR